jgi:hypothetical protein
VLPAEGAPVVFSTQLAYDLTLHIEPHDAANSNSVDIPIKAEPSQGGLVPVNPLPNLPPGGLTAELRGKWGFDDWEGPRFHLHSAQPGKWTVASGQESALIVGREDTLKLEDDNSLCVDKVEEAAGDTKPVPLTWKQLSPSSIEISVPLKKASPGPVTFKIFQFGMDSPEDLSLRAYAEAAALDHLTLSVGDSVAVLRGKRLDEVAKADLDGALLTPSALSRVQDFDQLVMTAAGPINNLDPNKSYGASVLLQDGRKFSVPVTVERSRPQITLLNKGVQEEPSASPSPVHLGSSDDLPVDGRLVFFLRSRVPGNFPRKEKVEVAAVDGSFSTVLSLAGSGLMLEDARTAMGAVDPLSSYGASAFGPIQVRAISAEGVTGDWLPLGTLVRLPGFKELRCPRTAAKPCTLTGTNLFLAASIAATPDFANSTDVPSDFTGTQLSVPRPANGTLYLRLRDDPASVQTLSLPVTAPGQPGTQTPAAPSAAAQGPVQPTPPTPAPDKDPSIN